MATIAIDFDGTFTADPAAWMAVIDVLKTGGHTVICATARDETESSKTEITEALSSMVVVVFCGDRAKDEVTTANGFAVDIWIDDNPERCKKPFIPVLRRNLFNPQRPCKVRA